MTFGSLQIPVVADLPVGLNYQDHPTMAVNVLFGRPERVDLLNSSNMSTRLSMLQHRFLGTGKVVSFCTIHSIDTHHFSGYNAIV